MKNIFWGLAAAVLIANFSACRGCGKSAEPKPTPVSAPVRDAKAFLAEQGIDSQSLRVIGDDAFITYEASQALEFDHQLIVVWGAIMGVLSELAPGVITIVNTAGGEPAVLVKAQSADVKAFKSGQLTFEQFMSRLQITAAEN